MVYERNRGKCERHNSITVNELEKSNKYIDGVLVTTKYEHDVYGNKVTSTTSGEGSSYQKYTYNDKNQVTQIETEKGII